MNTILTYLMIVALGAIIIILVLGVVNMLRNSSDQQRQSNKLMQWRVVAQGIALILFTLLLFLGKKNV